MCGCALNGGFSLHPVPKTSTPLAERPEGKRLLESARAGDVIITARLDRAFRSAADALGTLEELKADGSACTRLIGRRRMRQRYFFHDLVCGRRKRAGPYPRPHPRGEAPSGFPRRLRRRQAAFRLRRGEGRLVPNASEQGALARMKAMREVGETYRTIGTEFGRDPKTVQGILERPKA
jgi:putative DNA-invertase from lambdoid prophage Rac